MIAARRTHRCGILNPSIHQRRDFFAMLQQDGAHQMRRDLIDDIPPRAFLDDAPIERHRVGHDEVAPHPRDIEGEIFFLAMRQLPQSDYCALVLLMAGNQEAVL